MATCISHNRLTLIFGLLGNFVSFLVYLAPLVTFYDICKRRSTQSYNAIPYLVALFSSMLLLYYAHLKGNDAILLITINSFGCTIEVAYLFTFVIFANSRTRMATIRIILVFNGGAYLCLIFFTSMVSSSHRRLKIVGWICAAFSVCVYAAPLSAMITVIKTKSVKSMPFPLSGCLTLNAIIWFFFGMFSHDYFIATPNMLGFLLGVAQITLHFIYRKGPENVVTQNVVEAATNEVTEDDEMHDKVTAEIMEIAENMNHRKNNNNGDEETTTREQESPKMDELHNITVYDHEVSEDEIVEIPEEIFVPKNSSVKCANQYAPLKPSVHNV